jgi:Dipeptidase
MKNTSSDCTEILVAKGATMDGSTIVARNEDGYGQSIQSNLLFMKQRIKK